MKEILYKYYGLIIDLYDEYEDGILFVVGGNKYYFVHTLFDDKDINKVIDDLGKYNIPFHTFVKNNYGSYISEHCVLFKMVVLRYDIEFGDINKFNNIVVNNNGFIDMINFWYHKLDYLEEQVINKSYDEVINDSFDYFVGIAECLLFNLKNSVGTTKITLSHKSLGNLCSIDYYNPLNISYDSWLKDIGYYIKYKKDYKLLDYLIDRINGLEKNYLFTRLCFPFEYFEIIGNEDNKGLMGIINNIENYENYLWNMERIFNIYIFSWIKK